MVIFFLFDCSENHQPPPTANSAQEPTEVSPVELSIEQMGSNCYKLGSPITIKMVFYNRTNKNLRIINYFSLDRNGGNIIPMETDQTGYSILVPFSMADNFSHPPDAMPYRELPALGSIVVNVDYYFPRIIQKALAGNNSYKSITPSPGQYFLRFRFLSAGNDDIWNGSVISNQINLCITE